MTLGNAKFKIVAAMAATLILTGAVMTGCGENSDSSATGTTAATTAAQTTANAAPGSSSAAQSNANSSAQSNNTDSQTSQSSDSDSQSSNSDSGNTAEKHGNITADEAREIALQNCEYGLEVTICDPSSHNGQDCWHVVVRDTVGNYYDCFVSSVFCDVNQVKAGGGDYESADAEVPDENE